MKGALGLANSKSWNISNPTHQHRDNQQVNVVFHKTLLKDKINNHALDM